MIRYTSFRELERYSRNDIVASLSVTDEIGKDIIFRLQRSGILKVRNESKSIDTEELRSSDMAVGEPEPSSSDKRYVFDYVGVIDLSVGNQNFIVNCFPKYIKRAEDTIKIEDMKPFVRSIERYNKSQQFTISIAAGDDERLQYNPLALAIFLLRDYWEHGIYANSKEILEHNGAGEIDWESTISQTIPLLRNGRPFYVGYFTTSTTTDESDYITRLHEYLLTKYSKHFKETGFDELFGVETIELYEGEQSDFGSDEYIEQRILKEINVQFVTQKQILLRAMYALIHKSGHMEEESGLSLYGTNTFHKVWEDVCAVVFDSQLKTPIQHLPMNLSDKYQKESGTLQDLIPAPRWKNYKNKAEDDAPKTLIPDYVSIYGKGDLSYFVIMDAKYYDISLPPNLAGQPGVDDVDKQYLYQLAYKDFIESHNLIPINSFLCPGDIETFEIAGEVEMPIFAGMNLTNIKVAILSAKKMLKAYLSGDQLDLQRELPELFSEVEKGTIDPETLKNGNVLRMLVEQFNNDRTKRHYIAVLRCLRDSFIWIPGNIKISDADENSLKNAKVGDTFTPQQDMRFVPDILQNGDEFFLPVFSNAEQMGEYGKHFSKIEKHFFEAMRLALTREDVCGIVLDPFTAPYVARKEDFDFVGELPSMLKLDREEGE